MQEADKPMTRAQEARYQRLLKDGSPRYVRCYDDGGPDKGGSIDRYTITFPKICFRSTDKSYPWREYPYLAMNGCPYHPQGFGQHGTTKDSIADRPRYGHMGKKIAFHDLPEDCQRLVLESYADYWSLPIERLLADCLRPAGGATETI